MAIYFTEIQELLLNMLKSCTCMALHKLVLLVGHSTYSVIAFLLLGISVQEGHSNVLSKV